MPASAWAPSIRTGAPRGPLRCTRARRAHEGTRRAAAINRVRFATSASRCSGVRRRMRATSSSMWESTTGRGTCRASSSTPAAASRRSRVSHDGEVSPSSMRAMTDWLVRARDASSRWESRGAVREEPLLSHAKPRRRQVVRGAREGARGREGGGDGRCDWVGARVPRDPDAAGARRRGGCGVRWRSVAIPQCGSSSRSASRRTAASPCAP